MLKCTGNKTRERGADSIFDIECESYGQLVEFFMDEITRPFIKCR